MAEISINSDLHPANTNLTVDGKKPKGNIKSMTFRMYDQYNFDLPGSAPVTIVELSYRTVEEMDNGDIKEVTTWIINKGNEVVQDSQERIIGINEVLDQAADLMIRKARGQ